MGVYLQVFGELSLKVDGVPVELPRSRITRGLLVYLALARRPSSRQKLSDLFCATTADPRASLRWALSKVRSALGEHAGVLDAGREMVAFEPGSVSVDYLELKRLLQPDDEESETALAALNLGEPLLRDFRLDNSMDFEAWRISIAGEAAQLQKKALRRLIATPAIEPELRIDFATKLVGLAPADPESLIAQLEVLVACDRASEAEMHYQNGRKILSAFGRDDQLIAAWRRINPALQKKPEPQPVLAPQSQIQLTADILDRPAIGVLPFVELVAAPENAYFGESLASDVLAGLSAWRLLPVISRNTSFLFKDSDRSAADIGREIGARYMLTGTLLRAADRLRLTVELLDCELDQQFWSARFDCELAELFDVEDELVARIIQSVAPEVETAERQRILRKHPESYSAWDFAMRSLWLAHDGKPESLDQAIVAARKAARLDRGFGLPHSIIAFVRFEQAMNGWTAIPDVPFREVFRATLDAANEALQIDPGSWMAHALAGVGELWTNRRHLHAADHLDRAIKLNPSGSWSYHFGGCILGFNGVLDEARFNQSKLFQIDPHYPYKAVVEADLGLWNILDGKLEKASYHLERSQMAEPDYVRSAQRMVVLQGLLGDKPAAAKAVQKLLKLCPDLSRSYIETSYPFRNPDHLGIFFDGLQRAGLNLAD